MHDVTAASSDQVLMTNRISYQTKPHSQPPNAATSRRLTVNQWPGERPHTLRAGSDKHLAARQPVINDTHPIDQCQAGYTWSTAWCMNACVWERRRGRAWSIVGNIRWLPRWCCSHQDRVVVDLRLSAAAYIKPPPLLLLGLGPLLLYQLFIFTCVLSHTHVCLLRSLYRSYWISTLVVNIVAVYWEVGSRWPGRGQLRGGLVLNVRSQSDWFIGLWFSLFEL